MSFAATLTINDVLAAPVTELSEEELLAVYGGTDAYGFGQAAMILGGVLVGGAAVIASPALAGFGIGVAIGGFGVAVVGSAFGY